MLVVHLPSSLRDSGLTVSGYRTGLLNFTEISFKMRDTPLPVSMSFARSGPPSSRPSVFIHEIRALILDCPSVFPEWYFDTNSLIQGNELVRMRLAIKYNAQGRERSHHIAHCSHV